MPKDLEFEMGLAEQLINEPELVLPTKKDALFVIKPIAEYEPPSRVECERGTFTANPTLPVRRILSAKPKNHL